MAIAIESLEPHPGIGQSNAFAQLIPIPCLESIPIIPHFDLKQAISANGSDFDDSSVDSRRNPMTNGIFDDRLENEVGDGDFECIRIDSQINAQSFAKAGFLDFEIFFKEQPFF